MVTEQDTSLSDATCSCTPSESQEATDVKSITALSFMTMGDADRWAPAYFELHQAAIDADACVWRDFVQELDHYFKDPQQQENAHAELRTMILKPQRDVRRLLHAIQSNSHGSRAHCSALRC